jgi:hypothetical protein
MKLEKVIAISGKPGLYQVISQSKSGVIVESLSDKKRFPVLSLHNVSTLNDIAIYTYEKEVPLREVFLSMNEKENGKTSVDAKAGKQELMSYFSEVLPDYDEDRVYASNIKKVISWYNSLVDSDFDFKALKEEIEKEQAEESAE